MISFSICYFSSLNKYVFSKTLLRAKIVSNDYLFFFTGQKELVGESNNKDGTWRNLVTAVITQETGEINIEENRYNVNFKSL